MVAARSYRKVPSCPTPANMAQFSVPRVMVSIHVARRIDGGLNLSNIEMSPLVAWQCSMEIRQGRTCARAKL